MEHAEIKQFLLDYPDGPLAPQTQQVVGHHLQGCPECQNELDNWRQISQTLLQPLRAVETELFVQKVMRQVRAYVLKDDVVRWHHFLRWAFPVLALSVSGFVATLAYTLQPTHSSAAAFLIGEALPANSSEALANTLTDDHLMDSVIMEQ